MTHFWLTVKRLVVFSFLVLTIAQLTQSTNAQDFGLAANLDPSTISEGDAALLSVVVSGDNQNLPIPEIAASPDYDVISQGRATNVQIINGVITATNTYRYQVIPKKAGTFTIDGITITANGRTARANPLRLQVQPSGTARTPGQTPEENRTGETKDYFLEATVDTKNPYVGQQITYTLRFYFAVELFDGPSLTEPTKDGFWSEVLSNKPATTAKVNGRMYRVLERTEALFPTQVGDLEIGRAQITTTIRSKTRRSRDPFDVFGGMMGGGEQITVRSNPVRITARSLPDEGRPVDFSGVVGNFTLTVDADRSEVLINEPITLTIRIVGEGNIKAIAEPKIPESGLYSSYQSKSNESTNKLGERLGGARDYEYVLIPRRAGQLDLSPVKYTFFNPKSGKYEELQSRAFTFNVLPGNGDAVTPDGVPFAGPNEQIGAAAGDVRFIKSDMGAVHRKGEHPIWNLPVILTHTISLLFLAASFVVRMRRDQATADPAGNRARLAAQAARKRLAKAAAAMNPGSSQTFYAEIRLAVSAFVADKVNRSAHGLTDDQVIDLLREHGVADEVILELLAVFRQCDASRFGSQVVSAETMQAAYQQADKLLQRLQEVRFVKQIA